MDNTIEVEQWKANWIDWLNKQGIDSVRAKIREKVEEVKEQYEKSKDSRIDEGCLWNPVLEANDGVDQYVHGGDCNLCKRGAYCKRQCRPNKLLKRITTEALYQWYIDENPEAIAERKIDPKGLARQLGIIQ